MPRILLLDNYDSFTYNLEHYLSALGADVHVFRNDASGLPLANFDGIVLSPGPGLPKDAGRMMEVIQKRVGIVPIFGVCLGMQGIAEFLGGEIYNQKRVKHGVSEKITLSKSSLFSGIGDQTEVGLYHSWAVTDGVGDFDVVARSGYNVVMAIENPKRKLYGVQFHPESVMSKDGKRILKNFLELL